MQWRELRRIMTGLGSSRRSQRRHEDEEQHAGQHRRDDGQVGVLTRCFDESPSLASSTRDLHHALPPGTARASLTGTMTRETRALIVAGRAIDSYTLTIGHLATLRDAVRRVPDLDVVVAQDEATYEPPDPAKKLHARVVVGHVLEQVPSETRRGVTADPYGPLDLDRLRAGLARARALDDFTTQRLARLLPRAPMGFTPAQRAATLTPAQRPGWAGVAYDATDFAATLPMLHLVAAGSLASAILARGTSEPLPVDEDGTVLEDLRAQGWVFHGGNNEQPARGVRGDEVLRVSGDGLGSIAIPDEALEGALYLLAQYD